MRIAILALAMASAARAVSAASPDGPVVIFLVDTLRPDRMSAYGAPHATTPAADRLAREGIVFEHAYALSSWTRASVGTLFTSLLPAASGALDRMGKLDPAVVTLPQLFRDHGWETAAFVGNANVSLETGFARGFDVFESVDAAEPGFEGHPRARAIVDPAVRFVERQTSPRFFLYVHVLDPHLPFNLEPAYRTLFTGGRAGRRADEREALFLDYDRAIRQVDDQFARLAAALRAKGFWDRATVVYTSDHGEEFYEHGGRGHGNSLYEEQVRVPLVVKLPVRTASARRTDLVSLADVLPTLTHLHALPREASWIGSNLLAPLPERSLYFTEDLDGDRLFALRTGAKKLVVRLYPKLDERLFDLAGDPGEKLGREIACGAPAPDDAGALLSASKTWRTRDIASFPRIDFEKRGAESLRFILVMSLPDDPQPFLTPNAYCRYAAHVRGSAFTLAAEISAGEPFRLSIAADERGEVPPHRLTVFDAHGNVVSGARRDSLLRTVRVERPTVHGESEDEIRKLRNLGYLGGP